LLVTLGYLMKKKFLDRVDINVCQWFSPSYEKASEQGAVPQKFVALMSFWDMVNAIWQAPAMPYIPLALQMPMMNTVTIWTAIIAYFYLKTRFKMVHYIGIILVMFSCLVGVVVELQGPPDVVCDALDVANETTYNNPTVSGDNQSAIQNGVKNCVKGLPPYRDANGNIVFISFATLAFFYFWYILMVIPMAVGGCYKQKKLKQCNLDIMWSFFWFGMWQVVWGIAMFPAAWIPWPTPEGYNTKSPATLTSDLQESWTCFMGTNPVNATGGLITDTCEAEPAWAWFMIYLLFNVFYNLLMFWLIKRLSATWATIGVILCGNLCGVLSQYELFGGESAMALTFEQWLGLILASVSMWVYNLEPEVDTHEESTLGFKQGGDHRYDKHGPMGLDPDSDGFDASDEPFAATHTGF